MWRSWYLYIYMHSDSWKMGIWTPPVLGQHGCPTFDGPPHHPPTVWPRESWWRVRFFCRSSAFSKKPVTFDHLINLKLTWEPNHQDSNMGTTFLQNNILFYPANSSTLCGFLGLIHWPIRSCQKENPKPSTNYHRPDVEKDLIFGKNPLMIRPPNFHRNHG